VTLRNKLPLLYFILSEFSIFLMILLTLSILSVYKGFIQIYNRFDMFTVKGITSNFFKKNKGDTRIYKEFYFLTMTIRPKFMLKKCKSSTLKGLNKLKTRDFLGWS